MIAALSKHVAAWPTSHNIKLALTRGTRRHATVADAAFPRSPMTRPRAAPAYQQPATLTIRDGPIFSGQSFGSCRDVSGEAVFTTSIVGYNESLTDPSYRGQILVFTQPLIGNYGVPSREARDEFNLLKHFESEYMQPAGVVVADVARKYSHWTAIQSLGDWCTQQGVAAITGVDTRAIVTFLRERGSELGKISIGEAYDADQDEAFQDPANVNLVKQVSTKAPFHIASAGDLHIALIDCGVKEGILRSLSQRGASVTVFPWDFPIDRLAHHFDGVFISNGPGDPTYCVPTVEALRNLMGSSQIPVFGICLGHQLLALAAGAKTTKLKYGNRAHNIPCLDLTTGRCHITSQNHGYAVDANTLPPDFKEYWVNLNDSSNEGMIHKSRPIFSTQFHPEAKGGPMDTAFLFDVYLESVRRYKDTRRLLFPNNDHRVESLLFNTLTNARVGVRTDSINFAEGMQQQKQDNRDLV